MQQQQQKSIPYGISDKMYKDVHFITVITREDFMITSITLITLSEAEWCSVNHNTMISVHNILILFVTLYSLNMDYERRENV